MQVISEKRVNGELDRDSARVVSLVRTLGALEKPGAVAGARHAVARATDPWESHLGSIMNPMVLLDTIDAIRALIGHERDALASRARTNRALGVGAVADVLSRKRSVQA